MVRLRHRRTGSCFSLGKSKATLGKLEIGGAITGLSCARKALFTLCPTRPSHTTVARHDERARNVRCICLGGKTVAHTNSTPDRSCPRTSSCDGTWRCANGTVCHSSCRDIGSFDPAKGHARGNCLKQQTVTSVHTKPASLRWSTRRVKKKKGKKKEKES